jgi:beta-phosphoglucomutase-like phosphatase (HAD superfamily)
MLVIFDCDGVLVDTETISNRRLAEWLTEAGLPIDLRTGRRRFNGMTIDHMREVILAEDRLDIGKDFSARWYKEMPSLFENGVDAIAHVGGLIGTLDMRSVPLCVASSAKIEKMRLTLGATGMLERLKPVLFSASMVARGKPFPDLFLHAASQMGHAPENCVVIEDAVAGVKAGVAAGMRVLAYGADPYADREGLLAAGGEFFTDMREVPGMLGIDAKDTR